MCSSDNFKSFIVNAPWDSVLDSMIGISSREQMKMKSPTRLTGHLPSEPVPLSISYRL